MDYTNPFFPQEDFTIPIPNPNQHPSAPIQMLRRDSHNPLSDHMNNSIMGLSNHPQGHIMSPVEDVEDLDTSSRPRLTQDQIALLEAEFKGKPKPCTEYKKALALKIGLSLQRVNNWYQNRRAKARHQRPQERRFDVLPADPNNPNPHWAAPNMGFPDFQNGQDQFHDLSDQLLSADFMTIPSDELAELSKSFSPDLAHAGIDLAPSSSNTHIDQSELDDSKIDPLFMSNVNSIPDSKMSMSFMPGLDIDINNWVTDIQQEVPIHHDDLIATGSHFDSYPHLMYQSSIEGLSVGNPSCQTLVTTSSSDGDPCLLTPPPKTSPMPILPQDSMPRRGSSSSELAHGVDTIRLHQPRPRPGLDMFCPPPESDLGQVAESTPEISQPQEALPNSPTLLGLNKASGKISTVPRQDLASRRKRPRPATLRPDAQRSRSYAGPMTMSPNSKVPSLNLAPSPSVRRIKSTGQNMNVVGGRIQKSGIASAQLSPRNFQSYIDSMGLPQPPFSERQNADASQSSAPNGTPLTPLSPGKLDFQQEAWSNCSSYVGPPFSGWDQNQDQLGPSFFDVKHEITSPPITPFNKDAFPQMFPQERHQEPFYHCPPQSAPPQQTTFFGDSPPMHPSNMSQPSWQIPPSNLAVDGYAEDHPFLRANPMSQFIYSESQTPIMGPPQHYLGGPSPMSQGLPKFYGIRTPEKEIEIQVKLGPKPQGAPLVRKKYQFNHTTPKDFSQSVYT